MGYIGDDHNKMITFGNEMTNTRYLYHKDKPTKWLLMATLLFGIFTFSGYAGNFQPRQQQAAQTEIAIPGNHKIFKQSLSYKKAVEIISCNDFLANPHKSWTNRLFTCGILTKVKFDSIARRFCPHGSSDRFLQAKTHPQSPDEDIPVTFIG